MCRIAEPGSTFDRGLSSWASSIHSRSRNSVDEKRLYDKAYARHASSQDCNVSCSDLGRARRRTELVLRSFDVWPLTGKKVLDVGCGLGFDSAALSEYGARVRAIDSSGEAIERVHERFPDVDARVGLFPDDCPLDEKYDVIWAYTLSLINTLDIDFIIDGFIDPAMARLQAGGSLVIGTRSSFDGTMGSSHWANWTPAMIKELRERRGLKGPKVALGGGRFAGRSALILGRLLRKRVPIAFHATK